MPRRFPISPGPRSAYGETRVIEPVLQLQDERNFQKSMHADRFSAGQGQCRRCERPSARGGRRRTNFSRARRGAGQRGAGRTQAGGKGARAHRQELQYLRSRHEHEPARQDPRSRHSGHSHGLSSAFTASTISEQKNLYWRSGQKIMAAARLIKRASAASFPSISRTSGADPIRSLRIFSSRRWTASPFSSSRSTSTAPMQERSRRIEAFLDSLAQAGRQDQDAAPALRVAAHGSLERKKVFLPPMTDHAHALAAAFRACGVEAEVLPESDDETVRIGREYYFGPRMLSAGADHRRS